MRLQNIIVIFIYVILNTSIYFLFNSKHNKYYVIHNLTVIYLLI